jgi:hypothetical protein
VVIVMFVVCAKTNPFSSNACSICNDVKYHAGETAERRGDCVVFRGCGGGCYVVNGQGGVGAAAAAVQVRCPEERLLLRLSKFLHIPDPGI